MQRVSALLPLWDRSKSTDSNNSNNGDSTATATSSTTTPSAMSMISPTLHNRSSTLSNKSASNVYHNQSNTSISNRFSNTSTQQKSGRSLFSWADRIGITKSLTVSPAIANAPQASSLTTPMGREAYWPSTIDRECEKAARILKSFCTDGFLDDAADPTSSSPTSRTSITSLTSPRFPPRKSADVPPASPTSSLSQPKKKIPPRIIQEAVGLAIFSCMRSGLWMSGSGGSGILIARKADGTWSPPSGIMLHTATVAFVMGVDIYDCVLVINSFATLEMFTRSRVTLGSDVPLSVGPLVTMGLLENDFRINREMGDSVLTYLKARGRHSPAQLHGSLVTERSNENEKFYNNDESTNGSQPIDIQDILAGNVRRSIPEILPLFEAIKAAEGRIDFDTATMDRLSQQPAPGDADIAETPGLLSPASPNSATFGIPDATDPDPFGIIALEMAGLEIREAGSKHRPASQLDFPNTSPTSPLFNTRFSDKITDEPEAEAEAERAVDSNNRASILSTRTQATSMTDAYTQTDVAETPNTSMSPTHSDDGKDSEAAAPRSDAPSIPELSVHTPPADEVTEDKATSTPAFFQDAPPAIPPRNRLSHMNTLAATADKRSSRSSYGSQYLTVDRAIEAEDQMSDGDETVASARRVEDERNEDADDEDEETDFVNETGDDMDDLDDDDLDIDDDDLVDDDDEEPVIFEVAQTTARPIRVAPAQIGTKIGQAQAIQVKGALVNIPKRIPPPLPTRSPARTSRASKSDYGGDVSLLASPMRNSFQSAKTVDTSSESLDAEITKISSNEAASSVEDIKVEDVEEAKDVESKDVESKDVESKDVESKDVESKDVESKDVESKDVESKDVESKDVETKGVETKETASTEETVTRSDSSDATYESNTDLTAVDNEDTRPLTPLASEPTVASIDESDLEPKTPRPDDLVKFVSHDGHASLAKTETAHENVAVKGDELDLP